MKIWFLCSSLQRGRDGVGDYTRRLAGEIIRQGCEARIIALCERSSEFAAGIDGCLCETQDADGIPVEVCRISEKVPWATRVQTARRYLAEWHADWVSIQFVCYGFHQRGWAWRMGKRLGLLCKGLNVHIMFHELWIGENLNAAISHRIEGALQRYLILRMIQQLKPSVVHTHIPTYQTILQRDGIKSNLLPLFSNIPVVKNGEATWLAEELKKQGWPFTLPERTRFWLFGFFGSLHHEWTPEPIFSKIHAAAKAAEKRVGLAAIGRLGAAGDKIWDRLTVDYGDLFSFTKLGEQPAERVSQFLQAIDFGIASSPAALVGKSGSVAAMLDHGVPVLVPRDDWRLRSGPTPRPRPHPLLHFCSNEFDFQLIDKHTRSRTNLALPVVSAQFLENCRSSGGRR